MNHCIHRYGLLIALLGFSIDQILSSFSKWKGKWKYKDKTKTSYGQKNVPTHPIFNQTKNFSSLHFSTLPTKHKREKLTYFLSFHFSILSPFFSILSPFSILPLFYPPTFPSSQSKGPLVFYFLDIGKLKSQISLSYDWVLLYCLFGYQWIHVLNSNHWIVILIVLYMHKPP